MLRQTFQGKDILIIHNIIKGNYIVIYEGETVEVDQRPITDQELEQMRRRHSNSNNSSYPSIILEDLLSEILDPLILNGYD